ncbi:Lrp/AsnC family transcriptional regulator [Burkholderia cepacia]|uniref:Lrp/AsnC family transcriptional regulator n=1 Tax=Burkholderia cepacia TaxID=292 RepID=UPI003A4DAC90
MDAIDRKLLELLQADATLPIAELAQRVNLSQTPCWKRVQRLTQAVRDMPEVVEVYRMSGETDYLLRVVVAGIDDYDRVYKQLIRTVPLFDVSSSFAMEQIKYSTALPVRDLAEPA